MEGNTGMLYGIVGEPIGEVIENLDGTFSIIDNDNLNLYNKEIMKAYYPESICNHYPSKEIKIYK